MNDLLQGLSWMVMSAEKWVWQYDSKIASDPDNGVEVIRALLEQLDDSDWNEKDVFGIHMAMEEAVMNAIKHGNQRDPSRSVHVVINLGPDTFYSCVTDEGAGFDPDEVPDPTLDDNLEKFSGRGLMLMRNFVDKVEYNDIGNSVELFKKKSA